MNAKRIVWTALFVVLATPVAMAWPEERERDPEHLYIGPRWGYGAYFTGLVGVEAQVHHFALALGVAPDVTTDFTPGLCGGLKYYFDPQRSSFYLGVCAGRTREASEYFWTSEDGVISDYIRYKKTYGALFGYRRRIGFGIDISAGIGGGIADNSYVGVVPSDRDPSPSETIVLFDLSMGVSF